MATVLQLSDTHLTAESTAVQGRDPAARLGAVVNAWLATGRKADLVLLSGDVADDASLAGCRAAAEVVSELRTPVFAIPGNHDSRAAVAAVFASSPSVELGEWRIVGVDSIVAGEVAGALDGPDLFHRLDSFDDRPTVVAVHHPPWSPSTNRWFRLPNWEEILAGLAQRPHVRAVVSGRLDTDLFVA